MCHRDYINYDITLLDKFQKYEIIYAKEVSENLNIKCVCLPSNEDELGIELIKESDLWFSDARDFSPNQMMKY